MKKYILTVTLNPAIDKTATVANFRPGRDFREQGISISAGGKGINVSRTLKQLRVATLATGLIGGHDGDFISQRLSRERIPQCFFKVGRNSRTSLTVIDPHSKSITRLLERGPHVTSAELKKFKQKFISLLARARFVVISGRSVPGAPDSFYAQLIHLAKKNAIRSLLDTSGEALRQSIAARPFMIKPNLFEARQATGGKLNSFLRIKQALRQFHRRGIEIVALTMGSRGAVVSDGNEIIKAIPPRVKGKTPVGCGDAFIAGFISSFIKNLGFADCVKAAVACGTANVLTIAPGFVRTKTVAAIYRQVKIERIACSLRE